MDDKSSPSSNVPPAARSADALRQIHARARAAITAQHERMERLEAQLTQQLDDIAASLADELSSQEVETGELQSVRAEADGLRRQFAEATAAWELERRQLASDAAIHNRLLDEREAEIDAKEAQVSTGRKELDSRQQVLDERTVQLNAQDRELRRRQEKLDADALRAAAELRKLSEAERVVEQLRAAGTARETEVESLGRRVEKIQAELADRELNWQTQRSAMSSERDELAAEVVLLLQTSQLADSELSAQLTTAQEQLIEERTAWDTERQRLATAEAAQTKQLATWIDKGAAWESQRSALENERLAARAERDELTKNIGTLTEGSEGLRAQLAAQLLDFDERLAERQTAWEVERAALEARVSAAETKREQLEQHQAAHALERAAWTHERSDFESHQSAMENRQATLTAERDELATNLSKLAEETQDVRNQLTARLANCEQRLASQQEAWAAERTVLEERCDAGEHKCNELSAALAAAGNQLEAARGLSVAASERDELQQKFALALTDVHRLRSRIAELEQELSTRPAADQGDSVELVQLRSERDAMAARITALEEQPAATVSDADTAQEIADLQRRFELAVEDVRDLKRKNSQLEAQLVEAKSRPGPVVPAPPAGGSNWEALKQQMLASLEGEVEDGDEEREQERASIENTIRITDEIVANKDRELAELRAQLAESGVARAAADDESVRELVDNDAVIQKHRERIAQLEKEMEGKLRAAELELSIERAKIAREQVQLADLRSEIDAMRGTHGSGPGAGIGQPKKRWLSKLGLSGDDE